MKFSKRALIAPMAGAMMLMGSIASVAADTDNADFNLDAIADPNVCSLEWTTTNEIELGELEWDSVNLVWPDDESYHAEIDYSLTATGAPGDRDCVANVDNSSFDNADHSVTLLPKEALQMFSAPLPQTYTFLNMSLAPIIGTALFDVSTASVNQNAPVDTYTSTLTVTFEVAP